MQCFDATIPCLDQEDMGRNYEIKTDVSKFSVKGRLRKSLMHWKQINAPQFEKRAFVEDAIHSLLDVNRIEELVESPGIIDPLSVSIQKSGKERLVLDLRHINRHLFKNKFKCEDVSVANDVLRPGDFMFYFDLKSCYYHIYIFPEHRKFLAFLFLGNLQMVLSDISCFQFCLLGCLQRLTYLRNC